MLKRLFLPLNIIKKPYYTRGHLPLMWYQSKWPQKYFEFQIIKLYLSLHVQKTSFSKHIQNKSDIYTNLYQFHLWPFL